MVEIKKIFTKNLIIFLIGILVLFTVAPSEKINAASGNQFKASIVGDKVNLTWKIENDRDYRVYRSLDGRNYDLLGIDGKVYSEENPIKVFQIIPGNRDNSNTNFHLMNWLRNENLIDARGSYANEWERKGRPRTSDELAKLPVAYFSEFSQRPDFYLKDSNGNWKYDVLFIGGLDSKSIDPNFAFSVEARIAIMQFIESGRGVIFGHDTLAGGNSVLPYQTQFNEFAYYTNIQLNGGENSLKSYKNGANKIKAVKRGLLTDSAYNIYQLSDSIGIHYSHNVGQQVLTTGEIWYKFDSNTASTGNDNVYVTTHGNVATIQLGHNEPDRPIPESLFTEEEHLLANLIYYCATVQTAIAPNGVITVTDKTVKLKDDVAPTVDIDEIRSDNNSVDLEISATDRGKKYTYVLAEYSKSRGGGAIKSTLSSFEYTTGIQNLYYTADFGKNWESTTNNSINLYINKGTDVKNLHFTASDNSNNITEPYLAYQIDAKTKKQSNLIYIDKKGNEHRVNKVLYKGVNDADYKQIDAYWYYDAKGKKTYKINIDE